MGSSRLALALGENKKWQSTAQLNHPLMEPNFNLIPKGYSPASDSLEQVWLACSRLIMDELNCFENNPPHTWTSPNENPCQASRNTAMSCIDKSRNWEAWTELLKCRETQMSQAKFREKTSTGPEPISCHEKVADLAVYRDKFFDEIVTPEVAAWSKEMSTVLNVSTNIRTVDGSNLRFSQSNPSIAIKTESRHTVGLLRFNSWPVQRRKAINRFLALTSTFCTMRYAFHNSEDFEPFYWVSNIL